MKTNLALCLATFLFIAPGAAWADPEPSGDLPAMIREKEKGVFFLRVLDKEGDLVSTGTGFLVDRKGTLVTALHVIQSESGTVGSVEAQGADGRKWEVEGVAASDPSVDLALLHLANMPVGAKALDLAGDELPERGAKVLALGHPQGFQFVSTDGIVSATHKTDQLPARFLQSGFIHSGCDVVWLQTTAAVGPGNSGGPLLDASGKVVGVVQWGTPGQGMNFALQVASVRKLLTQPRKLVTLPAFTQPRADLRALMADYFKDRAQFRIESDPFFGRPFGSPADSAKRDPGPAYIPKLLALAHTYRGNDIELEILTTLMGFASKEDCGQEVTEDVKKASERVVDHFCDDRRLIPFLRSRPKPTLMEAQGFLASLSKASSDPEIRGLAALACARSIDANADGGRFRNSALKFARAAAQCPPEVMLGPVSLAEAAGELVDMLTHSVVGCRAPLLVGTDQHGKAVGPATLKGQHTVVAFYSERSEFQTGVAKQLNQFVKYAEGRPLSVIGVLIEEPGTVFTSSGSRPVEKMWRALKDDDKGSLRKAFHITDATTVLLIDPEGVIRERITDPLPEVGMDARWMFSGGAFGSGSRPSQWSRDLMDAMKEIPGFESQTEKLAKLPNRTAPKGLAPSLLKGLVLRYSFDKGEGRTARDSSGKARHAHATGGSWTNDPETGGCYKLSKPGDQLTAGDYKGVTGAKPRTVAFWFKNLETPKKQHCNLVRWGKGPAAGLFEIRLQGGAAFAADFFRGSRVAKVSPDRLLDGKWHHFAVTLPEGGKLADLVIYIDGKTAEMDLEFKRSKAGRRAKRHLENNPLNTTADLPVTIGSEKVSGFFDDVMIWERALDGGEIQQLYKATGGRE